MGIEVNYKHISPWLLDLFKQEPGLVEPFTCALLSRLREPGVPNRETLRRDVLADMPDHLKKERLEEFDVVDEIDEDMQEAIKDISPKNAPRILDEAKSDGFSLGKYFKEVQFHISGEITDHGTSLLSQAVTGGENVGNDAGPTARRPFSAKKMFKRWQMHFQKSPKKSSSPNIHPAVGTRRRPWAL
jgi:hypothetical protein